MTVMLVVTVILVDREMAGIIIKTSLGISYPLFIFGTWEKLLGREGNGVMPEQADKVAAYLEMWLKENNGILGHNGAMGRT